MGHRPFVREEEERLRARLESGEEARCPRCDEPLETRPIEPSAAVSYVRRRILYLCGSCGGSLVVERHRRATDA